MTNHRAERQSRQHPVPDGTPVGGRRRAEQSRRHRFRHLPSLLTVAGLIAMALAGAAALTVNETPASPQALQLSSLSRGLSGTDAVSDDADPRERAISRDSERQALQDAADARLSQVAEQKAVQRNAELQTLSRAAAARAGEIAANQWHLPTTGYRLTAGFGAGGGLWASDHTGLDFAAPSGTPIVAVANGVITETGSAGAYGNQTIQTLDDGTEVWYCHQTSIDVAAGQRVTSGQRIGTVGSTGNSTGPHLHLEVRPKAGDPVDPAGALAAHGVAP